MEEKWQDPRQKRYSEEEQKEILLRWKQSSLSKKDFCKAEGIGSSTLYKWMKRSGQKLKGSMARHLSPVMLIEKAGTEKTGEPILIEVCLPGQGLMRFNLTVKNLVFL